MSFENPPRVSYDHVGISIATLVALGILVTICGCTNTPPKPLPCLDRATFGNPDESPYVLPFPVCKTYWLNQAYCYPRGGHRNQLASDFLMPIGAEVTAARSGVVRKVRGDMPDSGDAVKAGQHNHIMIEHKDGTVAFYAHLKQKSIVVYVGDQVSAGQYIAASGNSGNTKGEPHLHFGVYRSWPGVEGFDVAVNFRNTKGPLDERGGLIAGRAYEALPIQPAD